MARRTVNYKTQGTCSQFIEVDVDDNVIEDVTFIGGCNGNLQGICSLVRGMKVEDVKNKLDGIRCGLQEHQLPRLRFWCTGPKHSKLKMKMGQQHHPDLFYFWPLLEKGESLITQSGDADWHPRFVILNAIANVISDNPPW